MFEVETEAGCLRGVPDGRTRCWRGVPYAAPPTGTLRFLGPRPPAAWVGVRDASQFGPAALQPPGSFRRSRRKLDPGLAENCLTLNIWSPAADGRRRAVLVWVHGGGFVSGSGALYRGEPLAAGGDIVVVTLNYRLGPFGFVDFGPALGDPAIGRNLGLQDVATALGWVRRNIGGFGGDPARVTLAGHGAGATLASLLMSTSAAHLFDAVILQGGALGRVHAPETAARVAQAILARLEPRPRSLAELQAVSGDRLLTAAAAAARREGVPRVAPVFDGVLLPASLAEALDAPTPPMPMLTSVSREIAARHRTFLDPRARRTMPFASPGGEKVAGRPDEGTIPGAAPLIRRFAPSPATPTRFAGRGPWPAPPPSPHQPRSSRREEGMPSRSSTCPDTLELAERPTARGAPTWAYRFDYVHPLRGARHGLELLFLWPCPGVGAALRRGGFLTGLRSGLSERMRAAWTSFVRSGHPGEDWPPYRAPDRLVRLFALQDRVVSDPVRASSAPAADHHAHDDPESGAQA